jgi:hypothetical protein
MARTPALGYRVEVFSQFGSRAKTVFLQAVDANPAIRHFRFDAFPDDTFWRPPSLAHGSTYFHAGRLTSLVRCFIWSEPDCRNHWWTQLRVNNKLMAEGGRGRTHPQCSLQDFK